MKLFSEMIMIFSLMLLMNTLFMFANHPLSMGLILIFQTLMIAMTAGVVFPSFWYSYILILIFLGGMLIIFIYTASLASNEKLNMSMKPFIISLLLVMMFMLISKSQTSLWSTYNPANESFLWLFSTPIISLASTLIIFLFVVLVAIVKITKWWGGALRPMD